MKGDRLRMEGLVRVLSTNTLSRDNSFPTLDNQTVSLLVSHFTDDLVLLI